MKGWSLWPESDVNLSLTRLKLLDKKGETR